MDLSFEQTEALKELINIGVGRAASTLNEMLNTHITLKIPRISIQKIEEYIKERSYNKEDEIEPYSSVQMKFEGPFAGSAGLLFTNKSAAKLVSTLLNEADITDQMDELKTGTLSEIGNILINSIMGSISNILDSHLDYSVAEYSEGKYNQILQQSTEQSSVLLIAEAKFEAKKMRISGEIIIVFTLKSFGILKQALNNII